MIEHTHEILRSWNDSNMVVIEIKTKLGEVRTLYYNINNIKNGWRESPLGFDEMLEEKHENIN